MKQLIVGSEQAIAWVSDEDYEDALRYKWTLDRKGYPWGFVEGKRVYLHRWVADRMGLALDELIDHEDRYPLNANRGNLRYVNAQLNSFNRGKAKNNTSGFKGVTWRKDCKAWRTKIKLDGKTYHLGYFDDPISAAVAYDKAAVELFGKEFAHTNLKEGTVTLEDYKNAKPPRVVVQGETPYLGVSWHKTSRKYRARIGVDGKKKYLGVFDDPLDAARAYDAFIIENGLKKPTNASLGLLSAVS